MYWLSVSCFLFLVSCFLFLVSCLLMLDTNTLKEGNSVLIWACDGSKPQITKLLLQKDADPFIKNTAGLDALSVCRLLPFVLLCFVLLCFVLLCCVWFGLVWFGLVWFG